MKKLIFPLLLAAVALVAACSASPTPQPEPVQTVAASEDFLLIRADTRELWEPQTLSYFPPIDEPYMEETPEYINDPQPDIPYEWIDLLARLTMAEAIGECEDGQRLVIDTVLNRADNPHFPDNIYDVIYQPSQYSPIWNGGIDCYVATDEMIQLVYEELEHRMDYNVIFFRTQHFHTYGSPMFQVGNHYFSSYD